MATPETPLRIYGTNNATYGPVPKAEQIFQLEFLEIAPFPIPEDRIFFVWLRGEILSSRREKLHDMDDARFGAHLANATLDISLSAVYTNGERDEPQTFTIPLRTRAFREDAHIAIRDKTGAHVNHLTMSGPNDILADMQILSQFLRTGDWTFELVARLADQTCLFAISLTQRLEGKLPGSGCAVI